MRGDGALPDAGIAAPAAGSESVGAARAAARWSGWMLAVLAVVNALSSIDRQVLPLLLEQIKHEFGLKDVHLGLLTGPAFFMLYALCALPLAMVADRVSRRIVIALSLSVFSVMTTLSGLAPAFMLLVVCRMGVAIGEAGNVPATQAMVADIYPRARLPWAMSWLYFSQSAGSILGFLLGGFLGSTLGWRLTFLTVGVPGLLVAILAYVVLPKRNPTTTNADPTALVEAVSLRRSASFLWSQRTYRSLTLANALWAFASSGIALWTAVFIGRVYHLPPSRIGMVMAVVMGMVGAFGLLVLGGVAQKLNRRDLRWPLRIVALSSLVSAPLAWTAFLTSSGLVAWIAGGLLAFFVVSTQGSVASTVQLLVPPSMRSVAVAIKHVVVTAIGAGSAPFVVGLLNDQLAARFGDEAIRYTLAGISILFLFGAYFFYRATRTLGADIARAETWTGS
ncbi:MAG: hypothetical protein QOH81_642 [Sphingomonadales bacterium]|nr:hypothetical protein [Sphingomonadales bacterium]